jgi:FdhD protein
MDRQRREVRVSDEEPVVGIATVDIARWTAMGRQPAADTVVIEEPLEIRLRGPEAADYEALSVTMRTPGHDEELAVGFLYGEGLLSAREEVLASELAPPPGNEVRLTVAPSVSLRRLVAARRFYMTSSCGVCGRDSLEAVLRALQGKRVGGAGRVSAALLTRLPGILREHQKVFAKTGGLHGCGRFDLNGQWLDGREDVGRHNALDKLVGRAFLDGILPLTDQIVVLSGRASFELVQKAVMAGVSILAAVGAPSSLAVSLAASAGQTLVGFLGRERFNIYAGGERLDG